MIELVHSENSNALGQSHYPILKALIPVDYHFLSNKFSTINVVIPFPITQQAFNPLVE
jgi:hypothetical protein